MLTTTNELRARLHWLDSEIARHELSLGLLREARASVWDEIHLEERRVEELQKVYPVLTLPFEITSQIFVACLPELSDVVNQARCYPSPDEVPLVLTRVCRDWRAIAIATSALWRQVRMELDSDNGPGYIDSKWVALLDTWLERSEPHPLSVSVSNRSYADPDETLVPVLNRYSRRWRDVSLHLPFSYFPLLGATSLPLLERLTLSAHGSPDIINPIPAFAHSPLLRHVCLEGGIHSSDVLLPWKQLTSLEMYAASASDCIELLSSTPNIETCVLDIRSASHGLTPVEPLRALHSFTFSGPASWSTLRYLSMPALQQLDLTRIPPGTDNDSLLSQLFSRWQCRLRELKLYVRSGEQYRNICLLRSLTSLEEIELTVAEANGGNSIFNELDLCSGRENIFLPRLTSASLHCISDDNHHRLFTTVTAVLEKSPVETSRRLTRFTLSFGTEAESPSPEILRRWMQLAANGMELCIENLHTRWI